MQLFWSSSLLKNLTKNIFVFSINMKSFSNLTKSYSNIQNSTKFFCSNKISFYLQLKNFLFFNDISKSHIYIFFDKIRIKPCPQNSLILSQTLLTDEHKFPRAIARQIFTVLDTLLTEYASTLWTIQLMTHQIHLIGTRAWIPRRLPV